VFFLKEIQVSLYVSIYSSNIYMKHGIDKRHGYRSYKYLLSGKGDLCRNIHTNSSGTKVAFQTPLRNANKQREMTCWDDRHFGDFVPYLDHSQKQRFYLQLQQEARERNLEERAQHIAQALWWSHTIYRCQLQCLQTH